jgi:LysR family transcriptional regulator, regulator for genes of the gallate degradation pathway
MINPLGVEDNFTMEITASERASAISFMQLRLYESIARLRSVRRASKDCNLSQPAVTQSLAKLEQLVGATLVERRANGSYLNEFGEMFYRRVERFFNQFEVALEQLGAVTGPGGARSITTRILRSQVRTLIATVENGTFGLAAQSLGLAQASLQRAARDLQSNLRRPLYYRTAAGMTLTPEGIEFGRCMKLALQEIDWGIRDLEELRGGLAGPIVVGALPQSGSVLLASMLEGFMRRYPRAEVTIRTETAAAMHKSLHGGDVDFVVGLIPATAVDELTSEPLVHTPYSIVSRRGHPLLSKERISQDDLMRCDWLIGLEGSSRRACFDRLFGGRVGASAPIATSADSIIYHILVNSDRLTLMTFYELLHHGAGLMAVPYEPITPVPAIGITTRTNWLPNRLHTAFIEMTREHATATLTTRS